MDRAICLAVDPKEMFIVSSVRVVEDRIVHLGFSDGSERDIDLRPLMRGPLFEGIAEDDEAFGAVWADDESGTICWPNGADLDPDVLHGDYESSWSGD